MHAGLDVCAKIRRIRERSSRAGSAGVFRRGFRYETVPRNGNGVAPQASANVLIRTNRLELRSNQLRSALFHLMHSPEQPS